jgi:hypothetical protein
MLYHLYNFRKSLFKEQKNRYKSYHLYNFRNDANDGTIFVSIEIRVREFLELTK